MRYINHMVNDPLQAVVAISPDATCDCYFAILFYFLVSLFVAMTGNKSVINSFTRCLLIKINLMLLLHMNAPNNKRTANASLLIFKTEKRHIHNNKVLYVGWTKQKREMLNQIKFVRHTLTNILNVPACMYA